MKLEEQASSKPRPYRQLARAKATEARRQLILQAFLRFAQEQWMDEITLEAVAKEAGVTMQTVLRHYGNKDGLIEAAHQLFLKEIPERRAVPPGAVHEALAALVADYELTGDVTMRYLAQEDRSPALQRALSVGRAQHRQWVTRTLGCRLPAFEPAVRERRINALIAATDVYVWKLLRRDFGHAPSQVVAVMQDIVLGLLKEGDGPTVC